VKVNVRVIAATNRDLEEEVARGNFRTDLYYRLNVIPLHLPSLRDRVDDIPLLVDHFLKRCCPGEYVGPLATLLDDSALRALQAYDWPGNVRELENVIERATIIREGTRITVRDLPGFIADAQAGPSNGGNLVVGGPWTLEELEKAHILTVLEGTGRARKQTADILGINASTLYRKLKKYGVQDDDDTQALAEDLAEDLAGTGGEELLAAIDAQLREQDGDGTAAGSPAPELVRV